MKVIKKLVWNKWNTNHIKKHKVNKKEVEEACRQTQLTLEGHNNRLLIIGKTNKNRLLTIVLAEKAKNNYYPVTARDTSRKERRNL